MKSNSSRELIKMIEDYGWYKVNVEGSHHQYKHPTKESHNSTSEKGLS